MQRVTVTIVHGPARGAPSRPGDPVRLTTSRPCGQSSLIYPGAADAMARLTGLEALKRAGSSGDRVLCIGDSLEHDILGGAAAGCRTALVRTGLLAGIGDADLEAAIAAVPYRPDDVLPSLRWD